MNWEAIVAIGQMLGSVAVLVTLGYLAVQVRHSRTALRGVHGVQVLLWIRAVLVTLVVTGCAGELRGDPPFTALEMQTQVSALVAKRSTRAEVVAALGPSLVTDPDWRVDVFRATSTETNLLLVLPAPVVLPFGNTRYVGFTIVSYSTSGTAEAGDAAIVASDNTYSPLLRAGDYQLAVAQSGSAELMVTGDRFLRELEAHRNPSNCMVLVGTSMDLPVWSGPYISCWPDQMSIDGGARQRIAIYTWTESRGASRSALGLLQAIQLHPGNRSMSFSRRKLDGAFDLELQCSAGAVNVVDLSCDLVKGFWKPSITGRASLSMGLDSLPTGQYVVLSYYYDGGVTSAFDAAKNQTGDH